MPETCQDMGADTGPEEFAARVRAARAFKNLDQKTLAKAMGYGVRTWARIEAGERPIDRDKREAVADLCGVPSWFMERGFEAPSATPVDVLRTEVSELREALDLLRAKQAKDAGAALRRIQELQRAMRRPRQ